MEEMKKINKDENTATPYDDVYRTLLNDCTSLIIPVVNEVFQRKHGEDEEITVLNNEFYITGQDGRQKERITDSNFIIGNTCYHFECQSTSDGTIIMRVFEYGSQIAIRDSYIENNVLTVHFPKTAILYLRQTKNTPDYMNICIQVPEASCTYRVPVMKVQNYSLQEIFDKKLFFLIPFHIFAYEKNFPEYESDEAKLQELMSVYQQIVNRLNDCTEVGIINEYVKKTVVAMSKKVLEALTVKYSKVKEGVGKIMGGKILDYEAKDILNQGREEGLREGRKEQLTFQVQKKLEKGDSVEKIADDLVEEVMVIKEIIAKLKQK